MNNTFKYEYTHKVTEDEYVMIYGPIFRKKRTLRRVMITIFGIAFLFWSYTFLLGFVMLALLTILIFIPHKFPSIARQDFHRSKILKKELTFYISDQELRVKGYGLDFKSTWRNLTLWYRQDGWLILRPLGMQSLYFPIDNLKSSGFYDKVIEHLKSIKDESTE